METYFDDQYPSFAAFGCDFFTRADQGDIIEDTADGPRVRRERILITDRDLDFEGRVCVGERTVRHLAHQLGMVDDWRVERIAADNHQLRRELVDLSEELAREREHGRFLRELEAQPPEKVFLALDGTEHAARRGAAEATAAQLGIDVKIVLEARAVPVEPPLEVAP